MTLYITTVIAIVTVLLAFGSVEAQFLKMSAVSVNYAIDAQNGYHNVVLVCSDAVLVYSLEMFIEHNDETDRYAVHADSMRLGELALQHAAYGSEDRNDSLGLLEGFDGAEYYPLLIPRYTPLVIPVQVLGDRTGAPTAALLDVTYAGNEGVACQAGTLYGMQKIGLITQITGAGAQMPSHILSAAQMAADDFNEYLESVGAQWSVELVVKDDQGNPELSLTGAQDLVALGVTSIVGPDSSESLVTISEYAERQQLVVVSGMSTATSLSAPDHIFRTIPDDAALAKALANILRNDGMDVAITIYRDDTHGRSFNDDIAREFQTLGGTIASGISYAVGDNEPPDYDAVVSELGDVVGTLDSTESVAVVLLSFTDTVEITRTATSVDALHNIGWYGSGSIAHLSEVALGNLGDFAEDVNFTAVSGLAPPTPLNQDVTQRLATDLGLRPDNLPDLFSYSTYDAVLVLARTIASTQSLDARDIIDAMPHVAARTYGAMSDDTLNENGDLAVAYYGLWKVTDNAWSQTGTYNSVTGAVTVSQR